MRFKPMPRYEQGAVFHAEPRAESSPTGTLFIQPRVDTREPTERAARRRARVPASPVLCWSNNPRALLGDEAIRASGRRWGQVRCGPAHDPTALDGTRRPRRRHRRRSHRRPEGRGSTPTPIPCCSCGPIAASPVPASRNARPNCQRVAVRGPLSDPGRRSIPWCHSPCAACRTARY